MPRRPSGKRVTAPDGTTRVRGKNSNRDGSVYTIDDGTWRATWHDRQGRRRYTRGRTRQQAIDRRDQAVADDQHAGSTTFNKTTTISELAAWWIDNIATQRVRPSSLGKYRDRADHVTTGLGTIRVVDLRPEGVATWLAQLGRQGLAPATIRNIRSTLRDILSTAEGYDLVVRNVATQVKAPKTVDHDGRALTADEAKLVIAAAAGDRLGAAVRLLFVQGWRVSEVLGLAWEDVDLDKQTATIRRASVYVDGQGMVLGPPKTAGARGAYQLSAGVVASLQARRKAQLEERLRAGEVWETHQYEGRPVSLIFTTQSGGKINRQTVSKAVRRAALAAGLDPAGLGTHGGRRTVVTALYGEEGVDLADVARHVGHADPGTTAGYVRHLGARPERTTAAAARLLDS